MYTLSGQSHVSWLILVIKEGLANIDSLAGRAGMSVCSGWNRSGKEGFCLSMNMLHLSCDKRDASEEGIYVRRTKNALDLEGKDDTECSAPCKIANSSPQGMLSASVETIVNLCTDRGFKFGDYVGTFGIG